MAHSQSPVNLPGCGPEKKRRAGKRMALFGIALLLSSILPKSGPAAIPTLEWQDLVTIDSPVSSVSDAAGPSAARWNNSWYLAYVKNDDVYAVMQSGGVWQLPVQVSDGPGVSSRPLVQPLMDTLVFFWEDDRTGHAEIWTRSFDGTIWSDETCLTEDATPSRRPSASTLIGSSTDRGIVAWEEGSIPSRIDIRWFSVAGFDPVETIASGPSAMTNPSVAIDRGDIFTPYGHIAWEDDRHGQTEIYARWFSVDSPVGPELRMSDLPGPCTRPSISTRVCCGDNIQLFATVAFEHTAPAGVAEVWTNYYIGSQANLAEPRSLDDGISSTAPSLSSTWYETNPVNGWCGELGGPSPQYLLAWTDEASGGQNHTLLHFNLEDELGQETISTAGVGQAIVVAEHRSEPRNEFTAAWVEEREGSPTLVARVGDLLSCNRRGFAEYGWFTIGPAGNPTTRVRFEDICTGVPAGEGLVFDLEINPELDSAIRWDPDQVHPDLEGEVDEEGVLEFSLYGGGCTEAGHAVLRCGGTATLLWPGVKSPDIDGDCAVLGNDLAYVQSQLGTDDFCADLDWSGIVDELDVAIVEATLGDACSDVTGVPEIPGSETGPGGAAVLGLDLRVSPNPAHGEVHLSLRSPQNEASLKIVDASGRRIADLGWQTADAGWEVVTWDGKDEQRRDVPSGIYYAEARSGDEIATARVLILR